MGQRVDLSSFIEKWSKCKSIWKHDIEMTKIKPQSLNLVFIDRNKNLLVEGFLSSNLFKRPFSDSSVVKYLMGDDLKK